jgi:hypothetical protein
MVSKMLTFSLLRPIASDRADYRVLLPNYTVNGTLRVPLGLRSVILCFALFVLLLARLLP